MKKLNKTIGTLAVLAGLAVPAVQAQTISGSFNLTAGPNNQSSFLLNEVGGQLANGTAVTGTFSNFQGRNDDLSDIPASDGIRFDDSLSGADTYSFDVTFSSNIQDIVITGYTIGDSQSVFTSGDVTLSITSGINTASGLSLSDSGGGAYSTSLAVIGNVVTFSESTGSPSAGGRTSISGISFQAVAVPEPSTYALLIGGLALGGVMIRRRMRA